MLTFFDTMDGLRKQKMATSDYALRAGSVKVFFWGTIGFKGILIFVFQYLFVEPKTNPDAPCTEYLPTFGSTAW